MYQNLLEQTVNIGFKDSALNILDEIEKRLNIYKDNELPVLHSMRSDLIYFKDYFNVINDEYLDIFDAIVKENAVIEKINETSKPEEKLNIQKHIINLYYMLKEKYPENPRLNKVLLNAYIKYAWYAIRSNKTAIAEQAIKSGYKIEKDSVYLKTNEGHLLLMNNDVEKASEIYNSIKDKLDEENNTFLEIISQDLNVLKKDNIISDEIYSKINQLFLS